MQSHRSNSDAPLIDMEQLGRLMRAARIIAGFDRMDDAVQAIEEATGVHLPARSLYALERGEQKATLEQLVALVVAYRPPTGGGFFLQSIRADIRAVLDQTGAQ